MQKIIIGKSQGKIVGFDLKSLIPGRLLIQANSGGGKSWLIRVLAEQAFGKIQIIIIDVEGEFSTLREKFGFVLVGKGGETPADPRSAGLVAHKLLELHASAVCDLYEMKAGDRHRWVKIFLEALIDAPKKLWHPVLVIVDEAHIFCPEKGSGESEASDAMIGLATRGRKRGFCAIFATQRLGKLRKDAAAELLNILVGQTFIDIDRKRAAESLGIPKAEEKKFFGRVKVMEAGQFYALGRAISKEEILVKVGDVQTTHPESGSYKHAMEAPPPPDKIKALLPKLADLPKAAEEKAKTEAELRTEIRSLKGMLNARPAQAKEVVVADSKAIEKAVREVKAEAGTVLAKADKQISACRQVIVQLRSGIERAVKALTETASNKAIYAIGEFEPLKLPDVKIQKGEVPRVRSSSLAEAIRTPLPHSRPEPIVPIGTPNGDVKLASGARRLLSALVSWYPNGMREGQWRSHAGLKKSGTADTYKSALRSAGFIEYKDGLFYATEAGVNHLGDNIVAAPTTTEEVLALWNPKLPSGARRILQVLVEAGGEPCTQEEITEKTGLQKSGTLDTYVSTLRTAQLVLKHNGMLHANRENLFL